MVVSKHIKLGGGQGKRDNIVRLSRYIADIEPENHIEEPPSPTTKVLDFDDYERLADYVSAHKESDKLHSLWIENCQSGDSIEALDLATAEIKATQDQNLRARNKTYHLMVSFQKSDRIPSTKELKNMEKAYAEVLGFSDHQRIVACHQDTDNFHFHVAYNKIHPKTFKSHSPSWDYYKRDRLTRELEKQYSLTPDNGIWLKADSDTHKQKPSPAKDMEAHRWEESFDGYVRRHKDALKASLGKAKSWQDIHDAFTEINTELKPKANGLVIASLSNKRHCIKASSIERSFSKSNLEERFGTWQPREQDGKKREPKDTYKPRPTTKHKSQARLWNAYRSDKKAWHKGWKSFLMQLALLDDPLAIAIVHAQKSLINIMRPSQSPTSQSPMYIPKIARKQSKAAQSAQHSDRYYLRPFPILRQTKEKAHVLIDDSIPKEFHSKNKAPEIKWDGKEWQASNHAPRARAKKLGAKWDSKQMQWYAKDKKALFHLSMLSAPFVLAKQDKERQEKKQAEIEAKKVYLDIAYEDKDKAKNAGARWDNDKKTWYTPSIKSARKVASRVSAKKTGYQQRKELEQFIKSIHKRSLLLAGQHLAQNTMPEPT